MGEASDLPAQDLDLLTQLPNLFLLTVKVCVHAAYEITGVAQTLLLITHPRPQAVSFSLGSVRALPCPCELLVQFPHLLLQAGQLSRGVLAHFVNRFLYGGVAAGLSGSCAGAVLVVPETA
ncbi:hypothetical protein ABZ915_44680 [Streptomyces sp. NPDC046915]|uniref:hypothetical protein n=1 Tax=Streptomyces sp. NPDC046915 TaxID=3155257 RepID=UPI0033DF9DB9